MIKKSNYIKQKLKFPQIYIDDLKAIEELVQNSLQPRRYEVETPDYEFKNISELSELKLDYIKCIKFEILYGDHYNIITFDFRFGSAEMTYLDKDPLLVGICEEIKREILARREHKILWFINKWILSPLMYIVSLSLIISFIGKHHAWIGNLIIIGVVVSIPNIFIEKFYKARISLFESSAKKKMKKETADKIRWIVISALISTPIIAILTLIIERLLK